MKEEVSKHFDFTITDKIREFTKEIFRMNEYIFFKNDVEKEYLFSLPKRVQKCYCSYCKSEFKESELKHNEIIVCPECGTELTCKNVRYGRKKLFNDATFLWFDKSITEKDVITCKGYYVSKDYTDYKNPKVNYYLKAVYVFNANDKKSIMLTKDWYGDSWTLRSSIFDFNIGYFLSGKWAFISWNSLDKAIEDTVFKYMDYNKFLTNSNSMVKMLDKFCKYQWLEQLDKIGMTEIVKSFYTEEDLYSCINYRGKDVFKKIRLNKAEVKEIREKGIKLTPKALRLYQMDKKNGFKADIEASIKISKAYYKDAFEIVEICGAVKASKYASNQYKNFNDNYYRSETSVLSTWIDYINQCKELKLDLNNKNILYPKDLHKRHLDLTKTINVKKNETNDKKILKRLDKLKEKYFYQNNLFLIRPAETSEDLINEGGKLNHCVAARYTKLYANGETDILLLRDKNNPYEPFVTVEVRDYRLVQAYGKNNTIPDKKVQDFLKEFRVNVLEKYIKKGKIA